MSSDETFLEVFMESLSTLPLEIRRNLDLLKDLDSSCGMATDRLQELQKRYILQAEDKMMELEVLPLPDDEDGDGDDNETLEKGCTKKPQRMGVAVLGSSQGDEGDSSSSHPLVVFPTTDELMEYTYDKEMHRQIVELQQDCLQKSDEKVAVAKQTYSLVDARVQQLDRDLQAMEKLLQATGNFEAGAIAKPNDLAACQVTPGAEWILSKVIHHDPAAGMYKLADEDIESNKIFHLPESQVSVLQTLDRLSKGDVVFAVYPDTTSFYQATVTQGPRKSGPTGQFVMVNFVDDSDEFGVTHDKAVPLKYVMLPP